MKQAPQNDTKEDFFALDYGNICAKTDLNGSALGSRIKGMTDDRKRAKVDAVKALPTPPPTPLLLPDTAA
jgi:hypothetical protein